MSSHTARRTQFSQPSISIMPRFMTMPRIGTTGMKGVRNGQCTWGLVRASR